MLESRSCTLADMIQREDDEERMCGYWRGEQIAPHGWLGHRRTDRGFETVELWVLEPEASHASILELARAAQDVGQLRDGRYVAILEHSGQQAMSVPGPFDMVNPVVADGRSTASAAGPNAVINPIVAAARLRAPEHLLRYEPPAPDETWTESVEPESLAARIKRALASDAPQAKRTRRIGMGIAGAVLAICAVMIFVPRDATAQSATVAGTSSPTTVEGDTLGKPEENAVAADSSLDVTRPLSPEDAAILIAGAGSESSVVSALGDISGAQLTAHRLSETGDFVLVRVDAAHSDGATTSATLLLQNGDDGWQMRNVVTSAL